ncbi:MAG: 2-C-methyl-D-erythritol 4-phosphate cytidylyltransferase [Actinomycetota bacterium]
MTHDAACPFAAAPALFDAVIAAAASGDVRGAPGRPDRRHRQTRRRGVVVATEPRGRVAAQTPQAFVLAALRDAFARASAAGEVFTDDAAAVAWAGYRVRIVPGDPANFKVTTPDDVARAEAWSGARPWMTLRARRARLRRPPGPTRPGRCSLAGSPSTESPAWPATRTATRCATRSPTPCWAGRGVARGRRRALPDTDPGVAGIAGMELLSRVVCCMPWASPRRPATTVIGERPAIAPRRSELQACSRARSASRPTANQEGHPAEGLGLAGDGIGALALVVLR